MKIDYSNPKIITRTALLAIIILAVVLSLLTGCSGTYYIVDDPYDNHSTEVYYHNDVPYWGFYNDYYYYYGKPHIYPWWYYYTLMPQYTYNVSTHVSIYCNNGYYVNKPRGPKFNNNRGGTYKPTNTVVKPNRSNNRHIRTNVNRTNVKVNTNKNKVKVNRNKNNVKINRTNNVKINRTNNVKVNTNRNNVKTRVNRRKPR
jgi:hypothetical protein